MIPPYINCQTNEDPCDWMMVAECKNTCPYAMSSGVGAMVVPVGQLEKEIEDGSKD